jgi:hypothetical protein
MDRRDFLKGALAVSGATVLTPAAKAAPASVAYVRHYDTNVGAPPGTLASYGKHTQWKYCPKDGKIRAYGGDGDWSLQDTGFKRQPSLNAVLAYDFGNGGKLEQETKQWVYNSRDDKYYAIPGYPVSRIASQPDPHRLIKINVVHKFVRATRKWEEGPAVGKNWVPEHWGGAYDPKRNRVWIQCQGQGEFGSLKWFDCEKSTFGLLNLPRISGLARIYNVGYELRTERWPQAINPVTDEFICFDGYRGHIVGIALSTLTSRVIGNVPALRSDSPEPVGAIETGLSVSVHRQKVFLSYSQQSWAVVGGKGGVWTIDLKTGAAEQTPYPNPPGENSSWTGCEYDDTNDCLILSGTLDPVWGRRFLRYEFPDAARKSAGEATQGV